MKKLMIVSLVLSCVIFLLFGLSLVDAEEQGKDGLYGVYSAVKIGMTVNDVRNVVKRFSPKDLGEISESLESPGDSTSGTFDVQIVHNTKQNPDVSHTRLTLLFVSEGYASPLVLVSARWEKNMRNGSSLEYSKKKGR